MLTIKGKVAKLQTLNPGWLKKLGYELHFGETLTQFSPQAAADLKLPPFKTFLGYKMVFL